MDELALRQLNGDEDEDEALRRALALSMGDTDGAPGTSDDTGANSDSGAKSRVHVRSLSNATTASTASTASLSPPPPRPENSDASPNIAAGLTKPDGPTATDAPAGPIDAAASVTVPAMSLLNLDRKAMEAERLARRQKALDAQQSQNDIATGAEASKDNTQRLLKKEGHVAQTWKLQRSPKKRKAEDDIIVIDDDDDDETENAKGDSKEGTKGSDDRRKEIQQPDLYPVPRRRKIDLEESESRKSTATSHSRESFKGQLAGPSGAVVSAPSSPHLPYARGVVKKTWVRGQPRRGDDVTIEEVWQKDALELAVLSSFQWDEDWMMSRLDTRRTRVMLIAYAADDIQKEQMKANSQGSNIRFCFPRVQTMGHMHSKLQLLKFPGHLRIAVPTGNLVPYDWGESGTLENMVFLIDLPKLPKGRSAEGTGTPFMEDLSYFLTAQGVDAAMVQSLHSYDFSETVRYAFVHSISGSHMDESWKRTGYSGLGRAVKAMGWASTDPIQVDYICSSVGSVSDDLLNALYFACQGK
ncbi:hypothetical protein SPBR_00242 [Sporothrix brasiliensis 5110]|uniref:Tyrosyl-DNA phosphodiesterase 1 n=1 Tax=Sporothrix brasiliensis 5110 TaxID=1398154 RepID=A0A0C2IV83_9PEZI|nr:uncharacterized protein SPBR_00242 [Sporothrix brasiliensis 5110]KIH90675.1 hypothetical protein SPBR_00242 [Sporothrix brasiliensis 5110]